MVLSLERWTGKVAIVTGASAGIGRAIAENLVKNGLIVAGFARRKDLLEQLAQELSSAKGKLYPVQVDITKEEDIVRGFQYVKENIGPVHILVNNAGTVTTESLLNGEFSEWKKVLDLNVLGLCVATREATKVMKEEGIDGHVIHINSVLGHIVSPHLSLYSASKHAVTALTEALRLELNGIGSKIKITSISPGLVDTELAEPYIKLNLPNLKAEDLADAVQYVLSTPPHVQVHEVIIHPVGEQ